MEVSLTGTACLQDQDHPFEAMLLFPEGRGLFQQAHAPGYTAYAVRECFFFNAHAKIALK